MRVTFLGQSGVVLESGGARLLIDPYLSDFGRHLGFARGIPIPAAPEDFAGVLAVVCTHEHLDHLDPLTLAPLLAASPSTVLVAPAAALGDLPWAVDEARLRPVRGEGDELAFGPFSITSLPAAHSTEYRLERTEEHGHRWTSVVVEADGARVLHTGDSVDYDGFAEAAGRVDAVCIPINGRGREDRDIVGNFEPGEAADFVRRVGARQALALHWDMFPDANPGDPHAFAAALLDSTVEVLFGEPGLTLEVGSN